MRDALRPHRPQSDMPTIRELFGFVGRMAIAVAVTRLLLGLAAALDAPPAASGVLVGIVLVYVVWTGHCAAWPRTPSNDRPFMAGLMAGLRGAVLLLVFAVVSSALLVRLLGFVGLPAETALIVLLMYLVFWMVRLSIADFPRVLQTQSLVWFLVVLYLMAGVAPAFGIDVREKRVDSFYTPVAAVDVALLIAAWSRSAWARRSLALEGLVFVAVLALVISLISCFVVLGRGADSNVLLGSTVIGPAAGIVLMGVGVVRQLAPDLLQVWGPRATEQLVGEELGRHGWVVVRPWTNRRPFGYDLKARRGKESLYVAVKSPAASFAPLELTPDEWQHAQKHGQSYVVAVVDFFGSDELRTWYVKDPAATASPIERAIPAPQLPKLPRAWIEPHAVEARSL